MPLNKQSGNMYDWVTHTWNPLGGECKHDCPYCYAKKGRMGRVPKYKGDLRIIDGEFKYGLGENKVIFVCSMNDLFQKGVRDGIIDQVLGHCRKYPLNSYLFQSKNPERFLDWHGAFPGRTTLCTTIETDAYPPSILPEPDGLPVPAHIERYKAMVRVRSVLEGKATRSVTIEPIMKFDLNTMVGWMRDIAPRWVSIGADSKGCKLPEPSKKEIEALVKELEGFTQVIIKQNLRRIRR